MKRIAALSILLAAFAQAGTVRFDYGATENVPPVVEVNQTPAETVELLTAALKTKPVAARRAELVRDIGACRLPAGVPALVQALGDEDPAVRCAAAKALGEIRDKSALPSLLKAFDDPSTEVRIEIMQSAALLGDESLVNAGLQSTDDALFVAACAIAKSHFDLIAKRMVNVATPVQYAAIQSLGKNHQLASVPQILPALQSNVIVVVATALDALREMHATSTTSEVEKLLSHKHPTIRRKAIEAMGVLSDPAKLSQIAGVGLQDSDASVRVAAANVLRTHPDASLLPQLLDQLASNDKTLNASAREAIVALAPQAREACIDAAVKLLRDTNPRRKEDGSFLLGAMGSNVALADHIRLLEEKDPAVVRQAARSLGMIGDKSANAVLLQLASRWKSGAENQSAEARDISSIAEAFIASARLGNRDVVPVAKAIIPDKLNAPVEIRAACIWAVGVLDDDTDDDAASRLVTVLNDNSPFEVERARVEAAHALANLHRLSALPALRTEGKSNPLSALRYACHQAADALEEKQTAYLPPEVPYVAETCIQPAR